MTKQLTLVEARKKAWSIGGVVARFFQNLFIIKCPKCNNNSVHHSHSEYTGNVWIEIYQCRKCREKFV